MKGTNTKVKVSKSELRMSKMAFALSEKYREQRVEAEALDLSARTNNQRNRAKRQRQLWRSIGVQSK